MCTTHVAELCTKCAIIVCQAVVDWKDEEGPTVDELARQLRQYEESLSSSLVLAVEKLPDILAEKLSQEFQ